MYSFDSTLHIVQLALDTSEGGEDFLLSGHCAWRVSDAFAPLAVSYAHFGKPLGTGAFSVLTYTQNNEPCDNDLGAGDHAAQSGRGRDAVQHREAQVQDDQSGGALPGFPDGSDPLASIAAGLERGGPVDEVANGVAHGGAVVDDEYSGLPGRRHGSANY